MSLIEINKAIADLTKMNLALGQAIADLETRVTELEDDR